MQKSIYKGESICGIVTDIKGKPRGCDIISVEMHNRKLMLLSCQEHLPLTSAYCRGVVGSTPFVGTVFYYHHNY